MQTTKLYAEDQVRDGVAFLNEQVPGWRTRINLQVLDLRNNEDCILGQLFGSYEEGTHALGLSPAWASLLGFFRHDNRNLGLFFAPGHEARGAENETWMERYDLLTATWKQVLAQTPIPMVAA